jgi:ABC-type nitrate/sulfonate/bicarbonate transport system ATPase subunit
VSFTYPGGIKAIENLTLQVRQGSRVGLIGPSGCGKSTILSLCAGLGAPATGSIEWASLPELRDRGRRKLSLVFQTDTLMPWLTVEDNVGFGLRYVSLSKQEKRDRIQLLLDLGRLADRRKSYPRELSGGMKRRVAFLAGVAPMPQVLLLDEPFAALDEPTRVGIHGEVLRIVKELDITVMLVTHDLSEAISLCDLIHVLGPRPTSVAFSKTIELGAERDVRALRESVVFHELYRELWHQLNLQTAQSSPD